MFHFWIFSCVRLTILKTSQKSAADDLFLLYVKVMQKLGKANETKDSTYDEFVNNFNKQQVGKNAVEQPE